MSVENRDGTKFDGPRSPDEFTTQIHRQYVGQDAQKACYLAALVLKSNGWTLEQICLAFGWAAKGHASRVVNGTAAELRQLIEATEQEIAEIEQAYQQTIDQIAADLIEAN